MVDPAAILDAFLASPYVTNEHAKPDGMHVGQVRAVGAFLALYVFLRHAVVPALSARLCETYATKLSAWERAQWCGRWISLLHCFPAVYLAAAAIAAEPGRYWTAATVVESFTAASELATANTFAYLAHDLFDLLKNVAVHGKHDGGPLVYAHHVFGILCYVNCYSYGKFGVVVCAWILTELSTPFLNAIWFYEKLGMRDARTYAGCALWLSYVPTRVALSPVTAAAAYEFWASFERLPLLCYGQFVAMLSFATVMNYFWFYKITKGLLKALRKTFGKAKTP